MKDFSVERDKYNAIIELAESLRRLQSNPDFVKLFSQHLLTDALRENTLAMYSNSANKEAHERAVIALAWLQNRLDILPLEAEEARANLHELSRIN